MYVVCYNSWHFYTYFKAIVLCMPCVTTAGVAIVILHFYAYFKAIVLCMPFVTTAGVAIVILHFYTYFKAIVLCMSFVTTAGFCIATYNSIHTSKLLFYVFQMLQYPALTLLPYNSTIHTSKLLCYVCHMLHYSLLALLPIILYILQSYCFMYAICYTIHIWHCYL